MGLGEKVLKYHRTLTTYICALQERGFGIDEIKEPMPPPETLNMPGMADELRRPMMLLISAKKQ